MKYLFAILISILFAQVAMAQSAAGMTYHGRLLKPNGQPVTTNVQFKIQILSPGNEECVLWEETQSQDLTSTSGVFVLHLNGSQSTRTDGGTATFNEVFSNRSVITPPAGKCAVGYTNFDSTLLPAAPRLMRVSFNDGSFAGWEDTTDQAINYTPKAIDALQVSGFAAKNLLRFAESDGTLVNTSPLSNAQYTELLALLAGTSSKYMTTSGGASLPTSAPTTLAAGKIWLDGTELKYYDGTTTQTLGTSTGSTQWSTGMGDISYSGKVGIGVTSPSAKLEVKGSTTDSTAAAANIMNAAGTSALYVRNDGSVGIGTVTPGYKLDVVGKIHSSSYILGGDLSLLPITGNQSAITSWWGLQLVGNRQANVDYTPTAYGANNAYGVLVPGQKPASVAFMVRGATSQSANLTQWEDSAGATLTAVDAAGKIGIGTSSPGWLLDVRNSTSVGQAHFSGTGSDDGLYLNANGAASTNISAGAATANGTAWTAKATSASIAAQASGTHNFYGNTGLTVGSTFTPLKTLSIIPFLGGSWLDLPTTGPSGIGSGGSGANAWIAYVASNSQYFAGSVTGDIIYRNANGKKILIGIDNGGGNGAPTMAFSGSSVGVGTTAPQSTLAVNGAITSVAVSNSSAAISFAGGNLQYTSSSCGAMTLTNLKSGGTYQLAVQGAAGGTCSFTAYSDSGTAPAQLTVKTGPINLVQSANSHMLFSFSVMGSFVYVTSLNGY